MGKIIAIANQQGGFGKTITAVNLSVALGKKGHKILVVDADPHGTATSCISEKNKNYDCYSLYDLLTGRHHIDDIIELTIEENVSLIPADEELSLIEIELKDRSGCEFVLKKKIASVKENYDYILIDCPSSLGLITANALVSADGVIIPVMGDTNMIDSLDGIISTIKIVKEKYNSDLCIAGILSLYDMVTADINERVFNTVIPRDVQLAESISEGSLFFSYAPNSEAAKAYKMLADEIDL